jgi:phosphoribosylformylglycinamidine synthase
LFGEDQARYLVACTFDQAEALMVAGARAGVPVAMAGRFGGDRVALGGDSADLAELSALYRGTFARLFG